MGSFRVEGLAEPLRLAGRGENRTPPTAGRVETFGMSGKLFDGDMDETFVKESYYDTGFTSHRGVHRVAGEEVTEERIFAIGRAAANLIARVEVAHNDWDALRFKICFDPLSEEWTDIS